MQTRSSSRVTHLLCENHPRFFRHVLGRVGDPHAAEDILQAAYLRAFESLPDLRDPRKVVPWFLSIVRSSIGQHFRGEKKAQRLTREQRRPPWQSAVVEPDPVREEGSGRVCQCPVSQLASLRPEYAAIVRAVDLEGRTPSAFAREAGISANNSRVRLHRARAALRRRLTRCCGSDFAGPGHRCRCNSTPLPKAV